MIRFNSDYLEGAHPAVLQRLWDTNGEQTPGYGEDEYCAQAARLIREKCGLPEAAVHFLVGGTQVNRTVISAALRPHQGVVAAETGHIAVHETGAIEASGHKVLALPPYEGKLRAEDVDAMCAAHRADESFEHMVQPGMVYISNSTEIGTVHPDTAPRAFITRSLSMSSGTGSAPGRVDSPPMSMMSAPCSIISKQ